MTRNKSRELGLRTAKEIEVARHYKLQDFSLLNECISKVAICQICRKSSSRLQLLQNNNERCGLAESLFVKCSECGQQTKLNTSRKIVGKVGVYEVMVFETSGKEKLSQFCTRINLLPPITKKALNEQLNQVTSEAEDHALDIMLDACARLRQVVREREPSRIEIDENGQEIASVAVTVDGTWQKRGHTSKIVVVFIISVETGEVLDYEVRCLYCHECVAHSNKDKMSVEFISWKAAHEKDCTINHEGSSGSMEAEAAAIMFSRSLTTRQLKYTNFVGECDSSCYGRVAEAMKTKYGNNYVVIKEECVRYVQKRMGSALTESKKGKVLGDGKIVGGAGRLTEDMIKRIQNYYGLAIKQNKGNLNGMQNAIKAIKHHVIQISKETLEEQHHFCPKKKGTWCKFWKDKLENTSVYSNSNRLPEIFFIELSPVFERLSKYTLLVRCLKGLTQNQNESVNGQLWLRVPKTVFTGKRRVTFAVCETVAVANTGAGSKAKLLINMGITPRRNEMVALRQQDKTRIAEAARKISQTYREMRKRRLNNKTKK